MLSSIIEQKNITPYRLAKDTGIAYSTLADIISGKTDIKCVSAQVLYKLAKGLGMSMEELYEGDGDACVVWLSTPVY